jgi:hypothetical protein
MFRGLIYRRWLLNKWVSYSECELKDRISSTVTSVGTFISTILKHQIISILLRHHYPYSYLMSASHLSKKRKTKTSLVSMDSAASPSILSPFPLLNWVRCFPRTCDSSLLFLGVLCYHTSSLVHPPILSSPWLLQVPICSEKQVFTQPLLTVISFHPTLPPNFL